MTEKTEPENKRKNGSSLAELVRYCVIGVSGATLDALLFYLLTHIGIHYQIANLISVSCGIVNNFFLNAFFNFKTKNRLLFRFCSFCSGSLSKSGGCRPSLPNWQSSSL